MIRLKTPVEIDRLRAGGRRLAGVIAELAALVRPGVATAELDAAARERIAALGDTPSLLNYQPAGADRPYPAALCVAVNDEVVHGIPGERVLEEGDIITLDLGLKHDGLFTDMALTVPVGAIGAQAERLLEGTHAILQAAVEFIRPGKTTGDLGYFIEAAAQESGFGVVRELCGHGVGYRVHEEPAVPNYGKRGKGAKLRPGMVIAVEPMFTLGSGDVKFLDDGYTVITADGSLAAHFEHTVAVTETGAEILTRP